MKYNAVLCVACTLILSGAIHGKDYYVAPAGSDSNPGSKSSPFATIAKARDAIRKGALLGPSRLPFIWPRA